MGHRIQKESKKFTRQFYLNPPKAYHMTQKMKHYVLKSTFQFWNHFFQFSDASLIHFRKDIVALHIFLFWNDLPYRIMEVHCVKSFQIRSFSGPCFRVFGLNTQIYSVNLRIQSEYRKIRTRKNSVFGHFSHNGLFTNPIN